MEFVRGGAGFVSAAAEEGSACCADGFGGGEELFFVFDGAGSCHEGEGFSADGDASGFDDGAVGVGFAADEAVTFLDAEDAFDLGECEEGFEVWVGIFVADGSDDGLVDAVNGGWGVAEGFDFTDDFVDFVGGSMGTDDDNHFGTMKEMVEVEGKRGGNGVASVDSMIIGG